MKGALAIAKVTTGGGGGNANGPITFNTTLPYDAWTSAAVFASDGLTLKRLLWAHKRRLAGSYSDAWDGTDDAGNQTSQGNYVIKLIAHNCRWDFDGVVGNTSDSYSGNVWRSFWPMMTAGDLAFNGTNGYMCIGGNEQQAQIYSFSASTPNSPTVFFQNGSVFYSLCAADSNRLYVGSVGSADDNTSAVFVTAYNFSDGSNYTFSSGTTVTTSNPNTKTVSCPYSAQESSGTYDQTFVNAHKPTGVGVGTTYLAVSVGAQNSVFVYNKTTGALVTTITITNPGMCCFDASDRLWVLAGTNTIVFYPNLPSNVPGVLPGGSFTGLVAPIKISAHPVSDILLIADGGSAQQVKAFDHTGASLWTFGTAGGYDSNGPAVTNSKVQWRGGRVPLAIDSNGDIWVCDGDCNRVLHMNASRTYLGQIQWVSQCECSFCDENAPTRVFNGFLEFQIDYTQQLVPGDPGASGPWKLVYNWAAGLTSADNDYFNSSKFSNGLSVVYKLSNNRTYALEYLPSASSKVKELVTASGLRDCGIALDRIVESLYADGSVRKIADTGVIDAGGTETLSIKTLSGFDGSNNPTWNAYSEIAHYGLVTQDPCFNPGLSVPLSGYRIPKCGNNTYVTYCSTSVGPPKGIGSVGGYHVGGVIQGGTAFIFKTSVGINATRPFTGDGSFQMGFSNVGGGSMANGRHVVTAFTGELGTVMSEADKWLHFDQLGIPIGEFGTTGDSYVNTFGCAVPGLGGNADNPCMVVNSNETYVYAANEANSGGPNRWHLTNGRSILDFSATIAKGATASLTQTAVTFPLNVVPTFGNTQVALAWTAIAAATYSVYKSLTPGGPYTLVASGINTNSYTVTGLTNWVDVFLIVTATVAAVESGPSDEVTGTPIATGGLVHTAGLIACSNTNYTAIPIDDTQTWPLILSSDIIEAGNLNQCWLGKTGYIAYEYPTHGSDRNSMPGSVTVTLNGTWARLNYNSHTTDMVSRIDGVEGPNNPAGSCMVVGDGAPSVADATVVVDPGDSNWYFLTLFMPAIFKNARSFSVNVTPFGAGSPVATVLVSDPANFGINRILQFMIKGKATVTIPAGAISATLQILTLDRVLGT